MNAKVIIFIVLSLLWAFYTVIEVLTKGIQAIYIPLGVLGLMLLPYSGYFSSRLSVLFGFSPFQLPIPLNPQFSQLGMFLTLPGLVIDGLQGKLQRDRFIYRPAVTMLILGSLVFIAGMALNLVVVDKPFKAMLNNTGGRVYIKHFLFLIAPLALYSRFIPNREIRKILIISFLLASPYIILDVLLHTSPGALRYLTLFMQMPNDFINFSREGFSGEVRFAAIGLAGIGIAFLCLAFIDNKRKPSMRVLLYFGVLIGFFMACLSGYRHSVPIVPMAVIMCTLLRRKIKFINIVTTFVAVLFFILSIYAFYPKLQSGIQRALYILPKIGEIHEIDFRSTRANDAARDITEEITMKILKENYAFGLGYHHDMNLLRSSDRIQAKLGAKKGALGFLDHMYNLGIVGFIGGNMIMLSGFMMAWNVFRFCFRRENASSIYTPLGGIAIAYYIYEMLLYNFEHGNSAFFFVNVYPPLFILIYMEKYVANTKLENQLRWQEEATAEPIERMEVHQRLEAVR